MSIHTILDQILSYKKEWILHQSLTHPLNKLKHIVQLSQRNFYNAVSHNKNQSIFILEYKSASPSAGIICKNCNPIQIAHIYKNYATAISVLTDEKYFHGNFNTLRQISEIVTQPILCKDFFISEWQVYFARIYQADAILLMLSILNNTTYLKLSKIAHTLNMGIITEIINENELKRAISLQAKVIGINNRNLHDFSVDINRTINLSKNIPKTITIISESGIKNHCQIKKLRRYVHGFLIGTTLMSQIQPDITIKKLILGENKVCGITQIQDAYVAYKLGAVYGGFIFVQTSPRYINITDAKKIVFYVKNLKYVGVFYNAVISDIINIVKTLNLSAVQLHGTENQNYINILKKKLPITCHIWKSINMNQKPLPKFNLSYIDRYLVDNENGGSGKTFNWSLLSTMKLDQIIIAGGLTIDNCTEAMHLGCLGLDFNSGIETIPGIKNHYKLAKIFKTLRTY